MTVPFTVQVLHAVRGHRYGANEVHILLEIAEHQNGDQAAWPSLETIAEWIQRSRSNVQETINRLEKRTTGVGLKVIRSPGGTHQTNRYVLVFHGESSHQNRPETRAQKPSRNQGAESFPRPRNQGAETVLKSGPPTVLKPGRESLSESLKEKAAAARDTREHPSARPVRPTAAAGDQLNAKGRRALTAFVRWRRSNTVVRNLEAWQAALIAAELPRVLEAQDRYATARAICSNVWAMSGADIRVFLDPIERAEIGGIEPDPIGRCRYCETGLELTGDITAGIHAGCEQAELRDAL